jgi:hypothetical protein
MQNGWNDGGKEKFPSVAELTMPQHQIAGSARKSLFYSQQRFPSAMQEISAAIVYQV